MNEERELTNKIIEEINLSTQFYINELLESEKSQEFNLKLIKEKYFNEIEKLEEKNINNDNNIFMDKNINKINEQLNKINIYSSEQNNIFKNINSDINKQFNDIYNKDFNNNDKSNEINIINNLNEIKNRINIFGNKEIKNRDDFKNDIFDILTSELKKVKIINTLKDQE